MDAENPEARAQYAQLPGIVCYSDTSTWDIPWKFNLTPWNKWAYNPTLREAIEDSVIEYPKGRDKRALVPGCGEGHDVIYIASTLGIHTTGLDLSPTAIERASSLLEATSDVPKDLINLKVEDFFSLKLEGEADRYDLIQDYTLFISIHPSQRLEWGRQMAALTKQGGYLITVVFPIDPKTDTGPPWYVRPNHYDEPLAGYFRKVVDKAPMKLPPGWPEGRQHLLVWQRV